MTIKVVLHTQRPYKTLHLFPYNFDFDAGRFRRPSSLPLLQSTSVSHLIRWQTPARLLRLQLAHVHDGTDAVAGLHRLESVVHLAESLAVGDELVDLEGTLLVVGDEVAHLGAALDAAEGAAPPDAAGDELECCSWLV